MCTARSAERRICLSRRRPGRKDNIDRLSGGQGGWGGFGGQDLLSDGKDDHGDGGKEAFELSAQKGISGKSAYNHGKRKAVPV